MIPATYFDGKTSSAREVFITPLAHQLLIVDGSHHHTWPAKEIYVVHLQPGEGLTIGIKGSKSNLVIAGDSLNKFLETYPNLNKSPTVIRKRALIVLFILALGFIATFHYSVPLIAKLLPYQFEEKLGFLVEKALIQDHKICKADITVLKKLGEKLKHEGQIPFNVSFAIIDDPETENAFAIPGGKIYIFTGLLKAATTQEEIIGILAHELGHVYHHHSTQGLIYALGISAFFGAMTGGSPDVISTQAVEYLLQMRNSRKNEREADSYALELLNKLKILAQGIANFFKRHAHSKNIELIATHPMSRERELFFIEGDNNENSAKLLTDKEFAELKRLCER